KSCGRGGWKVRIGSFVDEQYVESCQLVEEHSGGAVCQGGVHVVEEILGSDEASAIAVLQGFEQKADGEPCLADAGGADEDEVFGSGDEIEISQGADQSSIDARLESRRKGFEAPRLGTLCPS